MEGGLLLFGQQGKYMYMYCMSGLEAVIEGQPVAAPQIHSRNATI